MESIAFRQSTERIPKSLVSFGFEVTDSMFHNYFIDLSYFFFHIEALMIAGNN